MERRAFYGDRGFTPVVRGVETERQVTPLNAPALVTMLLDPGADPAETMPGYGGEHTTLELLLTSAHPAAAGVTSAVAKLLGPV